MTPNSIYRSKITLLVIMAKKKIDRIANIEDSVKSLASIVGQMVELQNETPKAKPKTESKKAGNDKPESTFVDQITVFADNEAVKVGKSNPIDDLKKKGIYLSKHVQIGFRCENGIPVQMGLSVLGKKRYSQVWINVADVAPMLREIEKAL